MHLILFLILFGSLLGHSYAFGFARPAWVVPQRTGKYGGNMVWTIGDVETVTFDCPWPQYKIELWQQSIVAAGAVVAKQPVYQQTLGQVLPQQFNWTVNKNQFDLQDSPVFFFWLKEVSDADNPAAQTSAFFNMTEKAEDASTTTFLPSSTASASKSSTPSTLAFAEPTTTSERAPAATQSQQPSQQTLEGLSTGATAGIAAAVGVAAIAATSCVILLCLKRRKSAKQQRWAEQQQPPASYYTPHYGAANTPHYGAANVTHVYETPKQHPQSVVGSMAQEFPNNVAPSSELPGDSRPPVAS